MKITFAVHHGSGTMAHLIESAVNNCLAPTQSDRSDICTTMGSIDSITSLDSLHCFSLISDNLAASGADEAFSQNFL